MSRSCPRTPSRPFQQLTDHNDGAAESVAARSADTSGGEPAPGLIVTTASSIKVPVMNGRLAPAPATPELQPPLSRGSSDA